MVSRSFGLRTKASNAKIEASQVFLTDRPISLLPARKFYKSFRVVTSVIQVNEEDFVKIE